MSHVPTSDSSFRPRDLNVHGSKELKLLCPKIGCSFEALHRKELKAHTDVAHPEPPRQFQCLEDRCGFSTTTQGALTRHYRERHKLEPPSTGRKLGPVRHRAPRSQPQSRVASASRISEPSDGASSVAGSSSPASSMTPTPSAHGVSKYYPGTVYYPGFSPHAVSPSLAGPNGDQREHPPSHSSGQWLSWRDESDQLAPDVFAIATGEQPSGMLSTTEYLPVQEDIGMVDKRQLWVNIVGFYEREPVSDENVW
ncbi:hypothetical protein B0H12DRAFT_1236158 [Mycena haematopus]|nr:hypothetical protein B0H12DRAFT_1236158 [Mycena haematopus]